MRLQYFAVPETEDDRAQSVAPEALNPQTLRASRVQGFRV